MASPIEHIRIRLQTQPHGAARLYNGPIDCVKKLVAHEGIFKGLYRGTGVTWFREAQAYGVWFTAFEFMMNQDAKRNGMVVWLVRLFGLEVILSMSSSRRCRVMVLVLSKSTRVCAILLRKRGEVRV
jgi:hypothetical protein